MLNSGDPIYEEKAEEINGLLLPGRSPDIPGDSIRAANDALKVNWLGLITSGINQFNFFEL